MNKECEIYRCDTKLSLKTNKTKCSFHLANKRNARY